MPVLLQLQLLGMDRYLIWYPNPTGFFKQNLAQAELDSLQHAIYGMFQSVNKNC